VLPSYRLRLEDAGPEGTTGEICLQGPGFLDAYYHPWRARQDILEDGWFRTGDIGELDSDGCLYIRGRSKDVINVLGAKFFPQEVEQVLLSHPAVREAVVFSEPDPRLGEVPVAQVVTDGGGSELSRELLGLCRQQLASFKLPHRIDFVSSVRRTASGKVLHRRITETMPVSTQS
jgi:acyl-CoA synthetase (AMP-forming)/AMP-acid ligase II